MADRDVINLLKNRLDAVEAEYNSLVAALGTTGLILHTEEAVAADLEDTTDATDLATAIVLANAAKATYNLHIASTAKHVAADATNPTADADATDQSTLDTLVNAMKVDFNAHQTLAASHRGIGGQGSQAAPTAISTADSTDAATGAALANAIKDAFNLHVSSGSQVINVVGN